MSVNVRSAQFALRRTCLHLDTPKSRSTHVIKYKGEREEQYAVLLNLIVMQHVQD